MKMTLLELVQDILNDMDGDEVNSLDDTFESAQVAQIIKSTYYAMMSNRNWPHTKQAIQIAPSGDSALPTHMVLQQEIKELSFINYNKIKSGETRKLYKPIRWLEPDDFLRVTNRRDNDSANVDVITDPTGVELLIKNDLAPTYYTSFDDDALVFDSYDITVDTTLQQSKIQAQAYVMPVWSPVDDFIPDLPSEAFTALLEESKSRAMLKLKQVSDVKAEQEAGRQQRWLARKAWRAHGGIKYPNYGRNSRKYKDVTFRNEDR
tara:strand:- start:11789 stop:12577 length:789 start_codon:yes stop_codon:yes gene_type:complete